MKVSGEQTSQDTAETCDRCGKEAAGIVGDERLCESCYHAETSCCGGSFDEGE
jgi:hypothetical protein